MSLVQLTLRPPPHVDFVSGYPGIPPNGTDRPQAAVKGALEVRVPSQGVKAQWVKVELRKVETLPGAGAGNMFHDIIGPGTVTLWTSGGAEYEVLHARDFPFSIRIPESVPPSLHLEQRAGIQYELVATVCTKGKKNFFRKRKYGISTTVANVIIDKHDLHSTWPVYCQPESRQIIQEGVKLTVDRNQSCYGPGDRMAVTATMKSESVNTVMLRSFEIFLKETITFRGQMFVAGKKGEPLTKASIISENRFQVNTPMHGGMQATQDLFCMLSPTHTNTTLSAARHVDITYVLIVKAHLGVGMPLVIELPVIVSNWQRSVSLEAMRRIGPAPGLSVIAAPTGINPLTQLPLTRIEPIENRSSPTSSSPAQNRSTNDTYAGNNRQNSYTAYSTASPAARGEDMTRRPAHQVSNSTTSMHSTRGADELGGWSSSRQAGARPTVGAGKRPASAESHSSQTPRFTIANALPLDIREEPLPSQHQHNAPDATIPGWLSAEEEKQRYQQAKARVDMVQGSVPQAAASPPPIITQPASLQPAPVVRNGVWLSAEDEKLRLFQNAQAAVVRTQGYSAAPSGVDPAQTPSPTKAPSAAAMMYSQAVSAMRNDPNRPQSASSMAAAQGSSATPGKPPKVPGYLTAEEEKAALKRYEDAKKAVDRIQNTGYYEDTPGASGSGLVSYDALYPSGPSGSTTQKVDPPPANDLPPPFEAGPPMTAPQQLSEKERLKRAYEAQDAAALSRQASANARAATPSRVASPARQMLSRKGTAVVPSPVPLQLANPSDSLPSFSESSSYASAAAEKEALRRRFEAQDAGSTNSSYQTVTPPHTPPRSTSVTVTALSLRSRPAPLPPAASGSGSGQQVLTAAEEKALLKARYEAQDAGASSSAPPPVYMNGRDSGTSNAGVSRAGSVPSVISPLSYFSGPNLPGSPPPLMPRPPQEYIQETREEDARVARLTMMVPVHDENGSRADVVRALSTKGSGNMRKMGIMPPLPPKPVGE